VAAGRWFETRPSAAADRDPRRPEFGGSGCLGGVACLARRVRGGARAAPRAPGEDSVGEGGTNLEGEPTMPRNVKAENATRAMGGKSSDPTIEKT